MKTPEKTQPNMSRTAGEAGWHVSRYNLSAPVPDSKMIAIANLFKGNCAEYTPIEMFLLSVLEELDENHPIIERFAKRGVICNFDERAALEVMGRAACAKTHGISLTICPTMGCNFDCPYCFEDHFAGKMSTEVQDDVVALAERMLTAASAKDVHVTWFGGEPLLACDVIESLSERLMALVDKRGGTFAAGIITNGYLLTQDIVDMLDRCKVQSAQVTIDGMGATHDWDPADPLATASNPDNLTMYLNTAAPIPDEECRECMWLPMCVGGCPHRRLFDGRTCIAFKDAPERYVLALHARIGEDKGNAEEQPKEDGLQDSPATHSA